MNEPEREKEIRHLVENVGLSYAEAEARLRNDDLWLLEPEMRYASSDPAEEARELERTAYALEDLVGAARWISEATWAALMDQRERLLIMAERARGWEAAAE